MSDATGDGADLARARELAKARQWDGAATVYQQILRQSGDHDEIMPEAGAVLFKAGRYLQALAPLSGAVLANVNDWKSAKRLALSVQKLGDLSVADDADDHLPDGPAVTDPEAVLEGLARRVAGQTVTGRLGGAPVELLEHGYPELDYAVHPGYGGADDLPEIDEATVVRRLYEAFVPIWNGYRQMRRQVRQRPVAARHAETFGTLERDGIVVLRMSEAERREMIARSEAAAQALREKRAGRPAHSRGVEGSSEPLYNARMRTEFGAFLEGLFRAHGITEMASAYHGLPMGIKLANLQINSVEDTSIMRTCTVGSLPLSPGYYMHIDSQVGVMKIIIYRCTVSAAAGAFRYVAGSNRIGVSPFELCLRKAIDKSNYDSCKPADRARFSRLPAFLQKKANFGNDLMAGDAGLAWLSAREAVMAGEAGDMLLFDNNGIHRGAIFEEGEREIIQVVLAPTAADGRRSAQPAGAASLDAM